MMKKKLLVPLLTSCFLLGSSLSSYASQWMSDNIGRWYQHNDGSYTANNWENIDGNWYYFDTSGYMVSNIWIGNYYLGSDGIMMTNTTTPDGYKVGSDGAWIPDTKSEIQQYKEIIDSHGYDSYYGHSKLTFELKANTLVDHGDYYQVDAIYKKILTAPGNLKIGDEITLTINDMTGESERLIRTKRGLCKKGSTTPSYEYQYTGSSAPVELYVYACSDDLADKPMCLGKLFIRKNATDEIAIVNEVKPITPEKLNAGWWYNGVYFDGNGYVTRLVIYGD